MGDLNEGTSASSPGNRLTTLIDLDNDKATDFVTVDDNGSTIRVYLYHKGKGEFVYDSSTYLESGCAVSSLSFSRLELTHSGYIR